MQIIAKARSTSSGISEPNRPMIGGIPVFLFYEN
jgi:hypothetical protein